MEDLELTHEEKKELEKRGFFVKNLISFKDILTTFPLFLGVHYLSFFILIIPTTFLGDALKNYSFFISIIIPWLFNQSIFLYFISKLFLTYIFQAKTFYYTDKQ